MTRRPARTQRPGPDLIGIVLNQMTTIDQVIVVSSAVCGLSDIAVARLVPEARWRYSPHNIPKPGRRIKHAHERYWQKVGRLKGFDDLDRPLFALDARAYYASSHVRQLCQLYNIGPDRTRQCAAPGCDETWPEWWDYTGGQPRRTCSSACRQRLYRHRKANSARTGVPWQYLEILQPRRPVVIRENTQQMLTYTWKCSRSDGKRN
jgi:hypothetical protein